MNPRFSIVTSFFGDDPSYVYGLYECVKSQRVDWEWIVTDDFSDNPETDKAILDISKKDKRVRRIIQKCKREFYQNPSLYASGEFIFHIDGDDLFHPSYLEHCQTWFDRLPDVSVILSGSRWVRKTGQLERYYIHTPFENLKNIINLNFLGRVWRSKFKIDWTNIFEDQNEMIRMNDKYIVDYISTKGDVLCLPRCYIQYETGKISNSTKERTFDEKLLINKVDKEFNNWFDVNKSDYKFSTYFSSGDTPDFEVACYPFHNLDWNDRREKIGVFGFSNKIVDRKRLLQLFYDKDIIFDPDESKLSKIEIFIINGMDKKIYDIPNKKINILTSDEDTRIKYFDLLTKKGRVFSWFLYNHFCWIKTIN